MYEEEVQMHVKRDTSDSEEEVPMEQDEEAPLQGLFRRRLFNFFHPEGQEGGGLFKRRAF